MAPLLEVGCGTGRNLALSFARHYPAAKLYGLDISAEMLETARANFPGKPVTPEFRVADATTFSAEEFGFATGFGPHHDLLRAFDDSRLGKGGRRLGWRLCRTHGSLHIVDFGQQERLPTGWFGRILKAWLMRFHVTPGSEPARLE